MRSDLAVAIGASGLRPMLKTAEIALEETWRRLLADTEPRIARGISRFARWASLRQIAPQAVDKGTLERYVAELANATLVRNLRNLRSFAAKRWNELVRSNPAADLRPVSLEGAGRQTDADSLG